ncbi:MAG TPA: helix-turn-helix domain-containing protein [Bryobacterales bacterium]|nr:helix-turn-helix domain-containing protein [Bryobacterales bacterium]
MQAHLRRLQQIGLNAYESRAYVTLIGHPRFKALDLATHAHVPRQKIYEVLGSLVEKGFAQVVHGKAKLFSAVEPKLALEGYLARRRETLDREIEDRQRLAGMLSQDLQAVFLDGNQDRGPLDYLRIVNEAGQIAEEYRRLLARSRSEYLEFSRRPYAVDPVSEPRVKEAIERGAACRLIFETRDANGPHKKTLRSLSKAGAEVRVIDELPLKLALFDGRFGMIALVDPVLTRPQITALVFEHNALVAALRRLFQDHWERAQAL